MATAKQGPDWTEKMNAAEASTDHTVAREVKHLRDTQPDVDAIFATVDALDQAWHDGLVEPNPVDVETSIIGRQIIDEQMKGDS